MGGRVVSGSRLLGRLAENTAPINTEMNAEPGHEQGAGDSVAALLAGGEQSEGSRQAAQHADLGQLVDLPAAGISGRRRRGQQAVERGVDQRFECLDRNPAWVEMQHETAGARIGAGFQDTFPLGQNRLQSGKAAGVTQGTITDTNAPGAGGNDAANGQAR